MFSGEVELIALFGELGEVVMSAEVVRAQGDRALPARDAGRERSIDVLECLFGDWVAGLADAIEDAAGFGLLPGVVAKESVFQGHLGVGGVDAHGLAELFARGDVVTDLQIGVGQVFADGGAGGSDGDGLLKPGDGGVIIPRLQGLVSPAQGLISRIGRLASSRGAGKQQQHESAHGCSCEVGGWRAAILSSFFAQVTA